MSALDITDWLMEQTDRDFSERRECLFKSFENIYGPNSKLYSSTYNIAYDLLCEEANLSPTTCKVINNLISLWHKELDEKSQIDVYNGKYSLNLNALPIAVNFYLHLKNNNKIQRYNVARSSIEEEFKLFDEKPFINFSSVLFAMTFLGLARVYHRNSVKIYYNNSLQL
tara:strand:- start:33 stop:539 length:507 start_codon:yes stop_codon:yes gene_type:complete